MKKQVEKELIATFLNNKCLVIFDRYNVDKSLCISLYDYKTQEPWATATIYVENAVLKPNEVVIKDYSENEGMLRSLIKAGIVKPTGKSVRTGWVDAPIAEVIVPYHNE